MDCTEFQTIVAGEREEDLSSAESQGFESHLESCGACREAVSRVEDDLERLGQLADPPLVGASAWARVDEAVRAEARRLPGREDPFGPLEAPRAPAVTLPIAPAMPVTLARPARPETRTKPLLAFVACAAAAAVVAGFLVFERPAGPSPIGRVAPPEADGVVVKDVKVGDSFKKIEGKTLVFLEGQ